MHSQFCTVENKVPPKYDLHLTVRYPGASFDAMESEFLLCTRRLPCRGGYTLIHIVTQACDTVAIPVSPAPLFSVRHTERSFCKAPPTTPGVTLTVTSRHPWQTQGVRGSVWLGVVP